MAFTFFTPLTGFAMRPNETNWPERYHRGTMDLFWQRELALPFQMPADYEQKVETGDPIRFQVKSTANLSHTLRVIDCKGKIITTLATTHGDLQYPGDLAPDGAQYTVYHYAYANWKNLNGLGDIFKGTYYLLYTVQYDASTTEVYISEPINIKARQENTVLMEYGHVRYYQGSPFDVIPAVFRFRVEGHIEDFQPRSVSTIYNDQRQDLKVLDYNPYRVHSFFIGEPVGIADWAFDKMNRIVGCSRILIDGKRYTVSTANPSFNKESTISSPQNTGKLEIQDAFDGEGFTSPVRKLLLWTSPATYPYMLSEVIIAGLTVAPFPRRIANPSDETNYITTLNTLLQSTELLGTITKTGNAIHYNNAPGETFSTSSVVVFTRRFMWNFNDPAPIAPPLVANFTIGNFNGVISWGDGTLERVTVGAVPALQAHVYSAITIFTIECWNTSCGYFRLNQKFMDSMAGVGPTNCETFIMQQHVCIANTFYFGLLQDSRNTLKTLDLQYNNLTGANNMPSWKWPALKTLLYNNNAFSSATMNLLIVDCEDNARTAHIFGPIRNGMLDVSNQTPPATLAANGTTARNSLLTLGWTVPV